MFSDLSSYYHRWYHSRPFLVGKDRQEELRRLHRVLLACARHLPEVWEDFLPLGEREKDILAEQSRYPFRLGPWRPDYIVSAEGSLLLCEITTRFFAHGIFMSWFAHDWAVKFMSRFPGESWADEFGPMMQKMLDLVGDRRKIYVLKSADRTSAIRLYKRFYEAHGLSVTVLEAPEVEKRRAEWQDGAFLAGALNQKDIMSLSDSTLRALIECGYCSDMRTVFLVHDKRFMKLWFDDSFTRGCIADEDASFLRSHAIPTFEASELTEEALADKDAWIVKPYRLGKSEGVHAGVLTSAGEWRELLRHPEGHIIQPFISQRTYPTVWEGTPFDDYVCGMMLCIDDDYFESGDMRCSSLPVTNVGDDRKAAVIYSSSEALKPYCDVL